MAYADHTFYKNSWFGNTIPDDCVEQYLMRASAEIDTLTFGRLRNGLPEEAYSVERIRMAVCGAAELLYSFELADKQAQQLVEDSISKDTESKAVKSISDGTESISYSTGSEMASQAKSISTVYGTSNAGREKLLRECIRKYLSDITDKDGVNLLFAGI